MNKFILTLTVWLLFVCPTFSQDTIKIKMENGTKIWVTSPDRSSLLKLKYLDVNHLIRDAIREIDTTQNKPTNKWTDDNNNGTYVIRYRYRDAELRRARRDSTFKARKWRNQNKWDIDLGLSNVLENGKFPDNANKPYGLNTIGSRYLAISTNQHIEFYNSPLSIKIGAELSINNLMFDNNNYITRNVAGDSIIFRNYNKDFQRNLNKSKLVIAYLNVPLSFRLNLLKRNRDESFIALDLGGYVGYRLGSYSSIKASGDGNKTRTNNSFLLTNWRYGLEAAIKIDDLRIFGRYDMNSLFATSQMPKLNMITFGVRI